MLGKHMKRIAFVVAGFVALTCGLATLPAIGVSRAAAGGLNANFAFGFAGTVISGPATGPIAGTGIFAFTSAGTLTGTETFNAIGTVCTGTLSGTYTLNTDGTGTITVTFTSTTCGSMAGHSSFVLSSAQDRMDLVGTDSFQVTSGAANKQ